MDFTYTINKIRINKLMQDLEKAYYNNDLEAYKKIAETAFEIFSIENFDKIIFKSNEYKNSIARIKEYLDNYEKEIEKDFELADLILDYINKNEKKQGNTPKTLESFIEELENKDITDNDNNVDTP